MGVAERLVVIPTPPLTVRATAEVTGDGLVLVVRGKVVVTFAGEATATVAAGLVVVIRGDTTATGVLVDTEVETNGVATAETTGVAVTVVPLTTPAVVTFGSADLDSWVDDEGAVDWADVTLATLTTDCAGVGAESVAVTAVGLGLVKVVLSTALALTACMPDVAAVEGALGVTALLQDVIVCCTWDLIGDGVGPVVGVDTAVEATVLKAAAEVSTTVVLSSCLATEEFCLLDEEVAATRLCLETAVAKIFGSGLCETWAGRGPEVEDTKGEEDVLLIVVLCPETVADDVVLEVVVNTGLEVDNIEVVVAAGLLVPGVPWVDTAVIFCEGDAEDDDTCCAVLAAFTGEAPAICTTVGVPNVAPCCTWSPVATC